MGILIVSALLVVPGVGAAMAVAAPGAASVETRVGLVVGLGYSLVAGVAILLALVHLLSRPTFVVGVIVVTLAVWALALRRAPVHAHSRAIVREAREAPYAIASGLLVIAAVAFTRPFYPAETDLAHWGPWRYWADRLELAAAGKVPGTTDQWGTVFPTTVSKVVLNAFEAGTSFLLGPDPFVGMRAILAVSAVGFVAVLLALGRELGLGVFAALVPALVLLFPVRLPISSELAGDFDTYKAENIGRLVAFTGLILGMRALAGNGSRTLVVVAAAVFALAGLTHGVPTVVAMTAFILFALGKIVVEHSSWRRIVTTGGAVVLLGLAGYATILELSGGDLGFQRVTEASPVTGFRADIDPTRSFDRVRVVPINRDEGPWLVSPRRIARRFATATIDSPGQRTTRGVITLALLGAATVAIVAVARRFVPLAVVAWGLAATFVAAALAFSYRYDTQIPGDFGLRRLYDYLPLLPALVVPAALEVLALRLFRRRQAVIGGLAVLVATLAAVAAVDLIPERPVRTRDALAAVRQVAGVVPCDARMLPNSRSTGSWEGLIGRRSVIEGLAPYLRPAITGDVLSTLIGARKFFADPEANQAYLTRHDVDFIVALRPQLGIGGWPPFDTDNAAIAALPGVEEVSSSPVATIYSVHREGMDTSASYPARCPV
jgi:hypothetical protein